MRVVLPFSPDLLTDAPTNFEYTVANAVADWPAEAHGAEFYVPAYEFSQDVVDVIAKLPNLKIVQSLTAGTDHIVGAIPPGVVLCNAPRVHHTATAELAVGLMISAQRRLADLVRAQDEHRWDMQMSSSLADKHVVIVGAGNIGDAIETRLAGFECVVTKVGRTARGSVRAVAELPEILPTADIVVLIVPITDQTRGLVDVDFLAAMPDGALLVNVSRGGVVVTDALVAETTAGRLRAALDVTDPEPLPADHPLWSAPGVIITPHVGGASSAMWPRSYALISDQLRRVAAGLPPINIVNG